MEKTCQDFVKNPSKERINLDDLPVDIVVKASPIETLKNNVAVKTVQPGKTCFKKFIMNSALL